MKKVLIISYYWPPAGGPGVQRILKYAKFLPENGWKPIILTVNKGEYPAVDESIQIEIPNDCTVIKCRSLEPYSIYKNFFGQGRDETIPIGVLTRQNLSWKKQIANLIRLNLFIPDARIGWYPYARKTGLKIIKRYKPEIILSSSPPATTHLIAQTLSRKSKIPWVADFRDPWTNIYHYDQLPKLKLIKKTDQFLENRVLKKASAVTVVSSNFFLENRNDRKIVLLPNGYDKLDMNFKGGNHNNKKFTIRYMGSLKIRQYVDSFYNILLELSSNIEFRDNICLEFIGYVDPLVRERIKNKQIPIEIVYHGYLPHQKALYLVSKADLLLHIIGTSRYEKVVTGSKLFEYLMVQKPILSYGPKGGEADRILTETGGGKMFDFNDKSGAVNYLKYYFKLWKRKDFSFSPNLDKIKSFDRSNLTKELVQIFEDLT